MYILVKLNPNQGINLGPNFTLTANVGTLVPATATLTQLLAGVSVLAADTATQVTITSQGVCTNPLVLNVTQPTTTTTTSTSTTTTTTTAIPCINYLVYADDGTEDKNAYPFSYISCAGATVNGSRVNQNPGSVVCAREGSVTSTSPFIYADDLQPCGGITTTTTTTLPVFISLGTSAVCSDDPCFTAGTTSWPCSGRVAINLTNAPSPYSITISYVNGNSGGSSIASVVYVAGLPYVNLSFDSSGSGLTVTVSLLNGYGVVMATSPQQTYAAGSTFHSGLPTCPAPSA